MKIYTRTGDAGDTGLFGGGRVPKDHPRVAAYGTVDELNAQLGFVVALSDDEEMAPRIEMLQNDLFAVGSILATPPPQEGRASPAVPPAPTARVARMEEWIDEAMDAVGPLRHFILPGGGQAAAALHVARTVCRRAEREVVQLGQTESVDPDLITYLNRLSDLLFAWARLANHRAGIPDAKWEGMG